MQSESREEILFDGEIAAGADEISGPKMALALQRFVLFHFMNLHLVIGAIRLFLPS